MGTVDLGVGPSTLQVVPVFPVLLWLEKKQVVSEILRSLALSMLTNAAIPTTILPVLVKDTVCSESDLQCNLDWKLFCELELYLELHLAVAVWYTGFIFDLGEGDWIISGYEYVWENQDVDANICQHIKTVWKDVLA